VKRRGGTQSRHPDLSRTSAASRAHPPIPPGTPDPYQPPRLSPP
jgi:hypothetical protein